MFEIENVVRNIPKGSITPDAIIRRIQETLGPSEPKDAEVVGYLVGALLTTLIVVKEQEERIKQLEDTVYGA